jgi:hypothetical protein
MGAAARRPVATTVAPRYDDKHTRPRVIYTYGVRAKTEAGTVVQRYGPLEPPLENIRVARRTDELAGMRTY